MLFVQQIARQRFAAKILSYVFEVVIIGLVGVSTLKKLSRISFRNEAKQLLVGNRIR